MATKIELGLVGITDKGAWVSGYTFEDEGTTITGYDANDIVHTSKGVYKSNADGNTTNPDTDTTGAWDKWVDLTSMEEAAESATEAATAATAAAEKATTAAGNINATLVDNVLTITSADGTKKTLSLADAASVAGIVDKVNELSASYIEVIYRKITDTATDTPTATVDGKSVSVEYGKKVKLYPTKSFKSVGNTSGKYGPGWVDAKRLDTSGFTDMSQMFYSYSALPVKSIDVSGWDTGKVTNMSSMFGNCTALTTLDVSGWDVGKVTNTNSMFHGFNWALTTLIGSHTLAEVEAGTVVALKNLSTGLALNNLSKLERASLLAVIKGLATVSGQTLTLGSTLLAKLTDADKKIATDKGWTLA